MYGSLALAVRTQADLPTIWCEWAVAGRLPSGLVAARPGVRYRWEEGDVRALLSATAGGRLGDAGSALRPRRGTVHAVFDVRDPAPALGSLLQRARAGISRLVRRGRRTAPAPS